MMSKSDLLLSERVLYDCCTEWNNYCDRRSYCLCQGFGHVSSRPVVGRLTCRALAWIFCSANKYSCGRKDSRTHKPNMATSSIASRKVLCQWSYAEFLSRQVPEAMQRQHRETERRQLRDCTSAHAETHTHTEQRRTTFILSSLCFFPYVFLTRRPCFSLPISFFFFFCFLSLASWSLSLSLSHLFASSSRHTDI